MEHGRCSPADHVRGKISKGPINPVIMRTNLMSTAIAVCGKYIASHFGWEEKRTPHQAVFAMAAFVRVGDVTCIEPCSESDVPRWARGGLPKPPILRRESQQFNTPVASSDPSAATGRHRICEICLGMRTKQNPYLGQIVTPKYLVKKEKKVSFV